ncbi:uncharacterized protein C5L36_0B04180 [Pichia kudriavzevii]|uniref:carnosine N-methyltransferase n=1 Tax=Pichia kudriavzevii TaxID=4909 RepID=A0A1V2LKQ1_PICKU|nr:uncharacterized protein C5L36_0B04180 [Pichia kudriavzevii]AWU75166.1 hypothetical protein C5L36_0B04180 [Pichia kudriavzevii]ONH73506.1 Carnosine N-methyltransferase [Pichia kudriavzevii]
MVEMKEQDAEEFKVLSSVLHSHLAYEEWAVKTILSPKERKYSSLEDGEKQLLHWFPSYIEQLKHSIEINKNYFESVAIIMADSWGAENPKTWFPCSTSDLEKMKGLMTQYVREWSSEGADEREVSFGRILETVEKLYPDISQRQKIEVLVPGAGLARLVVEFVKRGFTTQGNEISYHMLINSNYILNNTFCENNFMICPFIHKSSNVEKRNYQCRQIYFPDFNPGDISLLNVEYPDIPVGELMSMVAGGFVDLYGPPDLNKISEIYSNEEMAVQFRNENKGKFNVIATCYFLDTAANIIDYLKAIKYSLNDDGYWINFGPLLWHFEGNDLEIDVDSLNDDGTTKKKIPMSGLEIPKDDLIQLIEDLGFDFIEHQTGIKASYGGDIRSLGHWHYNCEFWVCRKTKK